jgi:hypothetical protein
MPRRLLIIGLAVLVTLAAAHALLWRWATERLAVQTLVTAEMLRAQGWTVTLGAPVAEGWPLAARVRFADVTLAKDLSAVPGGFAYHAAAASVSIGLTDPRHVVLAFHGAQKLRVGLAAADFTAALTDATLPLAYDPQLLPVDVAIKALSVALPDASAVDVATVALHLDLPATPAVPFSLHLKADGIDLPQGSPVAALGPRIARLEFAATLSGPTQGTLVTWRDGGGELALQQLSVDWGTLSLDGGGAVHLDAKLQPAGRSTLRLAGASAALDALVNAKVIDPRGATSAMAVLSLLQKPQPNGPPVIELPLTLQDQTLQLGHFRLLRMPDIVW